MKLPRRYGLLAQLLTGFLLGGVIVSILMVAGEKMLDRSSEHLAHALERHIRPLAKLHALESQLGDLRNQELELSHLKDVFVINAHALRMRMEIANLDSTLQHLSPDLPIDWVRLLGHWQDYRGRIDTLLGHAEAMDLASAQRVTESGSHVPYLAIHGLLREFVQETEVTADNAYRDAADEQNRQRRNFRVLLLAGSLIIFAGLIYSGKAVVRRIGVLRRHAVKLASGIDDDKIEGTAKVNVTEGDVGPGVTGNEAVTVRTPAFKRIVI